MASFYFYLQGLPLARTAMDSHSELLSQLIGGQTEPKC